MGAAGSRPFLIMLVVAARDVEQRGARDAPADLREQSATIRLLDGLIVEYHQPHVRLRENAVTGVGLAMLRHPPGGFGGSRDKAGYLLIAG